MFGAISRSAMDAQHNLKECGTSTTLEPRRILSFTGDSVVILTQDMVEGNDVHTNSVGILIVLPTGISGNEIKVVIDAATAAYQVVKLVDDAPRYDAPRYDGPQ